MNCQGIFFYKTKESRQNLPSAAVVIGALKVNTVFSLVSALWYTIFENSVEPDQLASNEAS